MSEITQAQIEAAAKAAWERYRGSPWPGNQPLWEDAIKASFVAAAKFENDEIERLRAFAWWVAEQRYIEDTDVDDICDRAVRELKKSGFGDQ